MTPKLHFVKLFMFLFISFYGKVAFAQAPDIQWERLIMETFNDSYANSIQQTTDGGYIVATNVFSSNYYDYQIVKLDASGNMQWHKTLGGPYYDVSASIQQTADGGYIVAGFQEADEDMVGYLLFRNYWIVKLDDRGNTQWQKTLGGSGNDWAGSVRQTADGGYIVAGASDSKDGDVSGNHGRFDYWVAKLNSNGVIQWQKCLGGSADDFARSIQQTTDGGYIVAGGSTSNDGNVSGNHGGYDYWVAKLDANGAIQWQKCLGGSDYEEANAIQQTTDGGYIVAGGSKSNDGDVNGNHGNEDFWVVKLGITGTIQWQKTLGGSGFDRANSIQQTTDGGYIVAGSTNSNDGDVSGNHGGGDYWVVKLDGLGNLLWQKCIGKPGNDAANAIQQTIDGGYIVAGETNDVTSSKSWVVKLFPDEKVVDTDGDGVSDNEDCAPNDATKWRSAELFIDADGDGYDNGKEMVCYGANIPEGYAQTTKGADCNDDNAAVNPATVWYKDADNDGYGNGVTLTQCTQPTGYKLASQLTATSGDCKDDDAGIHPGAMEICGNGIDEDCDGKDGTCAVIDSDGDGVPDNEDCAPNDATKWRSAELFIDADGDGYDNGKEMVCYGANIPEGYAQTTKGADCNDDNATINPATVWYKDADNDGYSDGATLTQCTQPAGYKLAAQLTAISGDCKDDDAGIHPGAIEICGNGIDEDCDGKDGTCAVVDSDGDGVPDNEDCAPNDATKWRSETLYIDTDGDGYDNGGETVCYGTDVPVGYSQTTKGKDCNDSDAEVNPGAAEQCDGKDNNCDGVTDEGCVPLPKISLSHATVLEGRSGVQYMIFNLRLNHVVDKPITVQYRTVNGTAKAGEDYTEKSGTVTFSANSLVQTIQVAIKGDVMYEDNERFTLELYNATNASIGNSVAIGTIINDDLPPAIKLYDAIVKEDAGFASVRVGLNAASGFPTRIGIKTKNGSAQAPGDYTTVETEVVLQPGETEKWIQIPIIWDYVKEGEERFYVYLSKLDNPALQLIYMFVGLGRAESVVRITNVDRAIDPKSQYLNSERPLEIKVLPNPAPIEFTLQIRDGSAEPVNIVVSDILGRKIENILNQKTNIDIKLGKNYRNGVYIIEVIQGDKRKVVQVMKLQ